MDWPEGGRGRESLRFIPSLKPSDSIAFPAIFLLFSAAICSVFASTFWFRPVARLISPPVCIAFDPRFLLFRPVERLISPPACIVFDPRFLLFRPVERLISPPVCIVFDPRFLLFRQKKITQAPTPGRCQQLNLFVWWVVLFCLAQHDYVMLPSFPRRFCFAPYFSFVSRGICSEVLRGLLLFRAAVFCCFRPFSIVLEPRILFLQPWAKQKKIT